MKTLCDIYANRILSVLVGIILLSEGFSTVFLCFINAIESGRLQQRDPVFMVVFDIGFLCAMMPLSIGMMPLLTMTEDPSRASPPPTLPSLRSVVKQHTKTTDLNDGLPSSCIPTSPRPSWFPKISPYRFIVFLFPLAVGTVKAVLSYKGSVTTPITLEWISGVAIFLV